MLLNILGAVLKSLTKFWCNNFEHVTLIIIRKMANLNLESDMVLFCNCSINNCSSIIFNF